MYPTELFALRLTANAGAVDGKSEERHARSRSWTQNFYFPHNSRAGLSIWLNMESALNQAEFYSRTRATPETDI